MNKSLPKITWRAMYGETAKNRNGADGYSVGTNQDLVDTRVTNDKYFSTLLEYEKGETSFWKRFISILQFSHAAFNSNQAIPATGLLVGSPTYSGTIQTGAVTQDHSRYEIYADGEELSTAKLFTVHLEFENIFKSNFDFYFNYQKQYLEDKAQLNAKRTGEGFIEVAGVGSPAGGTGVGSSAIPGLSGGFLTRGDNTEEYKLLVGTKYSFNERNFAGVEYAKSSDLAVSTSVTNVLHENIYDIMGEGTHVYYGFKPTNGLTVRIGAQEMRHSTENFGFVKLDSDKKVQNVYGLVKIDF